MYIIYKGTELEGQLTKMSYNNNNNRNYYNRYSNSGKKLNSYEGYNSNSNFDGSDPNSGNSSSSGYMSRNNDTSRGNYGGYRLNINHSNSKYGRYDKYKGDRGYRGSNSSYYHSGNSSSGSNSFRNSNSYNRRDPSYDRYDSYGDRSLKQGPKGNSSKYYSPNNAFKRNEGKDLTDNQLQKQRLSQKDEGSTSASSSTANQARENKEIKKTDSDSLFEDKPEVRFDKIETRSQGEHYEKYDIKSNETYDDPQKELKDIDPEKKMLPEIKRTENGKQSPQHNKPNGKPLLDVSIANVDSNGSSSKEDRINSTACESESVDKESIEEAKSKREIEESDDKPQITENEKMSKDIKDEDNHDSIDAGKEDTEGDPESPKQSQMVANSSYLSPIADSASFDGSFLNNLPSTRDEKESTGQDMEDILTDMKEEMMDHSEAETIISNSPPRINKGRKLIRKRDYDENRDKLIRSRKIIHSSDEEDDNNDNKFNNQEDLDSRESSKDNGIKRPYKIKRDSSGRSLLQRACKKGNIEDVKRLIERGASPNECDFCGFTCLHEAALEGHVDIVEFLIEKGADVNKQALKAGDLETPLIDAAENKHFETVKILLQNGADPRIFNIDGFTALTKIFSKHDDEEGYEEIIKILEEYNAKFIDSKDMKTKHQSKETLKFTASPSPSRIIEDPNDNYFSDLLRKKSHASSIYKYAAEGLKEFTANYFVEGGRLDYKPDILILASRNGHTELVDIILGLASGTFDVNQTNNCGLTALLASVGRGHYEVVKFLLSKGANPNIKRKPDGLNALEIAEKASHFDPNEVKLLQEYMNKSYDEEEEEDSEDEREEEEEEEEDEEDEDNYDQTMRDTSINELNDTSHRKESSKYNNTSSDESNNKKRKLSQGIDENKKKLKKSKAKESEIRVKPQSSSVFMKENTPDSNDELRRSKSREQSFSPSIESVKDDKKILIKNNTTISESSSPPPLTKAQEELKAKNAEEARIWQEKVEAKKRARRDMFLKSEKEREKKRKEDEEKRIEEEKRRAIREREESEKLAKLTEEKNVERHRKRAAMERQLLIENYPIGLRDIKFGIAPTNDEMLEYAPLYTFSINGQVYTTDLQIALLTRSDISIIADNVDKLTMVEVDDNQKSKLWNLFFPMIGTDKSNLQADIRKLMYEGHTNFQNLLIHFIRFDDMEKVLADKFPSTFSMIWGKNNISQVDLDSLQLFMELTKRSTSELISTDESAIAVDAQTVKQLYFIPPKLRIRKDALNTIHNSKTPLWK